MVAFLKLVFLRCDSHLGMGGGAASSRVQGSKETAQLDFNAVQRGDAEMENRMNRVIRACVEMGDDNPIVSIHDQVRTNGK
jgi:phosphoribosylformylglycinamidine synthase